MLERLALSRCVTVISRKPPAVIFRKIRRKLLSEKSYGICILYSSGEIILVVVGILLALQIDNWSDIRKQETQNLSYEHLLAVDLVQDTLMISRQLHLLVHDTTQLSSYINSMSSEEVTIDTLIQIARFEFNPSSKLSEDIWKSARYEELGAYLNGLIAIKFVTELDAINKLQVIREFTRGILEQLDEDDASI